MSSLRVRLCQHCGRPLIISKDSNGNEITRYCSSYTFGIETCQEQATNPKDIKAIQTFIRRDKDRRLRFQNLMQATKLGLLLRMIFDDVDDGKYIGMSFSISKAQYYQCIEILTKYEQFQQNNNGSGGPQRGYVDEFISILLPTAKMIPNDPNYMYYDELVTMAMGNVNSSLTLIVIRIYSDEWEGSVDIVMSVTVD